MTYLQSYDGLSYKMNKVDASTIPVEYAENLSPQLEALKSSFTDSNVLNREFEVNSPFVYLFMWTETFLETVKIANGERTMQEKLDLNKERMKAH